MDQRTPLSTLAMPSRGTTPVALRLLRTAVWAVCHFVFYFLQQLAELFAPLLLVAGAIWSALPALVGTLSRSAASADPQARDAIAAASAAIPSELTIAGHVLTAHGLIMDGVLLMALAAAAATLSVVCGRNL